LVSCVLKVSALSYGRFETEAASNRLNPCFVSKWTSTFDTPTYCLKFLFCQRFIDTVHPVRQTGKRPCRKQARVLVQGWLATGRANPNATVLKLRVSALRLFTCGETLGFIKTRSVSEGFTATLRKTQKHNPSLTFRGGMTTNAQLQNATAGHDRPNLARVSL
jgi:hypothetical protein